MPGKLSPTVLVVSDDLSLLDELVRHLEEIPHWRLVGSARGADELITQLRTQTPDAILMSEGPARELAARGDRTSLDGRVVVLGRGASVETLRAALDLGAKGFVVWPTEPRRLRGLVEEGLATEREASLSRGRVTALWGPKGGSGTSTLTAHLAGAMTRLGVRCILVDLDLEHGDQKAILGAAAETKTVIDLLRVVDELSPAVVENVAWQHPMGFGALMAPGSPGESGMVKTAEVVGMIEGIRELTDHVLIDLPSGFGDLIFAGAEAADRLLLVVTPGLLSLRRAREAMRAFRSAGIDESVIEVVLNGAGGDISPKEVHAVLGRPVVARIRPDTRLLRATDKGQLARSGLSQLEPLAARIR